MNDKSVKKSDSHTGTSFYGWNFVKVLNPDKFNRAMAIIVGPVNGTTSSSALVSIVGTNPFEN